VKRLAAEFIGTFALVFAGTGAIVIDETTGGAVTHVGVALTFGLIVLAMPALSKAATRFSMPWRWDGGEVALQSRCTDETGYVQPTREQLVSVRGLQAGPDGFNHYNGIKTWFVHRDGKVSHV